VTELSPEDRALLDCVRKRVNDFEETLGCHYRDGLWSRMDRLYHNYSRLRNALRGTRGNDRDTVYQDAMKDFGHELVIPYAFSIVETVLPALLSNRPRILILPNDKASDRNVENMRATIDGQQSQIGIELRFQAVAKSGLMYGLGVGKSRWRRQEGKRTVAKPLARFHPARALGQTSYIETYTEPLFDDPTFEQIPVRDFGWDQFGADIESCRYAWHRVWRDTAYVKTMLESGAWDHMALVPEDYETNNGSAQRYHDSLRGSFDAQCIPIPNPSGARENDIHEVIEYHDKAQIVTVLDRKWVVLVQPNETNYGRLPFVTYRPTAVDNQMVGKGEIEPVEDPIREMNMLRTDRRWAALMALQPVLFYNDGLIEPDTIKVGPGELNAVNGDPRDVIWQLDIHDVPASSYRETAEIASDIVRASGISDTFAGGESATADTATGVQLQLARASARIQNKTRRAEIEIMKPVGEHWIRLNQRHIIEQREVRVPAPPTPGEPERVWAHYVLGPGELAGNFDFEVDGGSTTPTNVPQLRADAQIKATIAAGPLGPLLDARQWAISVLEDLGVKNPEAMLSQGQPIPPEAFDLIAQHLVEAGMDPTQAEALIEDSLHMAMEMRDQQAQGAQHGPPPPSQGHGGQQGQGPPQQAPQQQAA
jgi:hypothetical protein